MWSSRYYGFRFPRSRPRQAKGGIKAQSKRGQFGQSWWAKRWIQMLESFNIGARLGRGRSYARGGQVLSVEIDKSVITAKVQGSRPKPYDITIQVESLSAAQWRKLTTALAEQALFAAKLLAGEMPTDIEKVFDEVDLSLFPKKHSDLETDCSCPDWSNPCKHIAAVYYLIGEEFDRDPFLLFKLRGLSRNELLQQLGEAGTSSPKAKGQSAKAAAPVASSDLPPEPLSADASAFWTAVALPADWLGEVEAPPVHAALPKRLGNFPFWRGQDHLLDALEPIYRQASQRGLEVFLGERRGARQPDG